MGVWDVYCNISGAMHFNSPAAFVESFESDVQDKVPQEILDGLLYSKEDVSASQDRVILSYYDDDDDSYADKPGAIKLDSDGGWMLHDVEPCDYQRYQDRDDPAREYVLEEEFGVVTHCSLVIFRHRFPDYSASVVSQIVGHGSPGMYHGAVARTQEQWVEWLNVTDRVFEDEGESAEEWWLRFLTRSDRTPEEIIHEAWMGPGNMWMFVRPDRFPISEALALPALQQFAVSTPSETSKGSPSLLDLPLDIIQELCAHLPLPSLLSLPQINKSLRALVLPHLDAFVRRSIEWHHRYLLPETPSSAYRSNEENEWWTKQWVEGGKVDVNSIPWTAFARACATSRSMRSRKRIWDIVGEMEAAARRDGII
ncbi:hypothetical protein FB45DRAFT_939528 [Roridomyces roridus]|uniref:F-box domain-containing protein n=1 Tax=Roridomyces roridus TaxID=1738132 RepID=A0AAD7FAP9_9AGAR|nr:hypothetical protein FB45DRAFT_939528 [Roridomyces roridus]